MARATREEIYARVAAILTRNFELDPAEIKGSSRLFEDLDLDSIDAVDMFSELFALTGRRIDPEAASALRTVDDVVDLVLRERGAGDAEAP